MMMIVLGDACRYTSDPAKQNVFKKIELFQVIINLQSPSPSLASLPSPLCWPFMLA